MKTRISLPQKIMIKTRVRRTRRMINGQELRVDNSSMHRELLYLTWKMT